jgi:hypothetical protein
MALAHIRQNEAADPKAFFADRQGGESGVTGSAGAVEKPSEINDERDHAPIEAQIAWTGDCALLLPVAGVGPRRESRIGLRIEAWWSCLRRTWRSAAPSAGRCGRGSLRYPAFLRGSGWASTS